MPAPVDVPLHRVIVKARPLVDKATGAAYQQLPEGTDPGALRLVLARDVRPGDWYLGACEQPTGNGFHFGCHTVATYPTTPRRQGPRKHGDPGAVAMDGESFVWGQDELVMVLPRELLPAGAMSA